MEELFYTIKKWTCSVSFRFKFNWWPLNFKKLELIENISQQGAFEVSTIINI